MAHHIGMKLLLDENVSPRLTILAHDLGIDAIALRDRGMLGLPDHAVVDLAFGDDRIIVTGNAADFTGLCGSRDLHPGLITIAPGPFAAQVTMLGAAIAFVRDRARSSDTTPADFMVNRVVEVTAAGNCTASRLPPVD